MSKASGTYDQQVFNKAQSPLAKRLQELITNPSALKDYLGCSLQAINQYKLGTAYPKTENLIKIAEYYGISVDYLLGRIDIPNMDTNIQSIRKLTGLSVMAICKLADFKNENNVAFLNIISTLIEDRNAEYFLALLCASISLLIKDNNSEMQTVDIGGIDATFTKTNLVNTALQTHIIENLPAIAKLYKDNYSDDPAIQLKKLIDEKEKK